MSPLTDERDALTAHKNYNNNNLNGRPRCRAPRHTLPRPGSVLHCPGHPRAPPPAPPQLPEPPHPTWASPGRSVDAWFAKGLVAALAQRHGRR